MSSPKKKTKDMGPWKYRHIIRGIYHEKKKLAKQINRLYRAPIKPKEKPLLDVPHYTVASTFDLKHNHVVKPASKDALTLKWYRLAKGACEFCCETDNLHVHHKDRNRLNNHPENLLVLCQKCHIDLHIEGKKYALQSQKKPTETARAIGEMEPCTRFKAETTTEHLSLFGAGEDPGEPEEREALHP